MAKVASCFKSVLAVEWAYFVQLELCESSPKRARGCKTYTQAWFKPELFSSKIWYLIVHAQFGPFFKFSLVEPRTNLLRAWNSSLVLLVISAAGYFLWLSQAVASLERIEKIGPSSILIMSGKRGGLSSQHRGSVRVSHPAVPVRISTFPKFV